MVALVDTEGFKMPEDNSGNKVFKTSIDFSHDWKEEEVPPIDVEIRVNIPEYCTGSGMGEKDLIYEFEYASCGYLTASLPEMFEEFLADYDEGYYDYNEKHLQLFKKTLLDMVKKIDQKVVEFS